MKITTLHSPLLAKAGIAHGFTERTGGVSPAPLSSLNTKISPLVPDNISNVSENFARIFSESESVFKNCTFLYLESNSKVARVNQVTGHQTLYGADGVVTNLAGHTLAIPVADCLPILLVDKKAGVIGVSHAGWKGSADRITTKVLKKMVSHGANPKEIMVSIGPSICGECYEVGAEVAEKFDEKFKKKSKSDKYLLDLVSANVDELHSFGVEQIDDLGICTYENTDRFFSARKENKTGRFLAYIKL